MPCDIMNRFRQIKEIISIQPRHFHRIANWITQLSRKKGALSFSHTKKDDGKIEDVAVAEMFVQAGSRFPTILNLIFLASVNIKSMSINLPCIPFGTLQHF